MDSLDGVESGEHNGIGSVNISTIFAMQEVFFTLDQNHFTTFSRHNHIQLDQKKCSAYETVWRLNESDCCDINEYDI